MPIRWTPARSGGGKRLSPAAVFTLALFLGSFVSAAQADPLAFHLSYSERVTKAPFTGRVYVMLYARPIDNLRYGPNWYEPEPFFALDVKDWKPGEVRVMDERCLGYPHRLNQLPKGVYSLQAFMDFDRGEQSFTTAAGNGYSRPLRQELDAAQTGPVALVLDQVVPPRRFRETDQVKLAEMPSKLLSDFHGRPVTLRAGVVLPKSHAEQPARRYPVVYEITGFGGDHFAAFGAARRNATDVAGEEMIWVVFDANCRLGHHVFADSDNNGPYGRALIEEFIPHIEKQFRGLGKPTARFLTGHSSGGWSSLWLQITYPDFFGGTWSTAPDEVDFRRFQQFDIYAPGANCFYDKDGKLLAFGRRGDKPFLFNKPFSEMEEVMGRGGQLCSFEAVFGGRGQDGKPKPLWDRRTGAIDPAVAKEWERYDIRLVMERNWPTLANKVRGKIRVYCGDRDTFYLEQPLRLLKESLEKLGSDAIIEFFPGRDHGNLIDAPLRQRMNREMAEAFRKNSAREGAGQAGGDALSQ